MKYSTKMTRSISIAFLTSSIIIKFVLIKFALTKSCETQDCINYAKLLKKTMNVSVDPCENFYDFVCGRAKVSTTNEAQFEIDKKLLEIVTENGPESNQSNSITNFLKAAYKRCDKGSKKESPMREQIKQIYSDIGKWPRYSSTPNATLKELWIYQLKFRRFIAIDANEFEIHIYVHQKAMRPLKKALHGQWGDEKIEKYFNLMIRMASLLGDNNKWPAVEIRHAFIFAFNITKMYLATNKSQQLIKFQDLDKEFPNIPLKEMIQSYADCCKDGREAKEIVVKEFQFLKAFDKIIPQTDPDIIENFLKWLILYDHAIISGDPQVYALLENVENIKDVITDCKAVVLDLLKFVVWWTYIKKDNKKNGRTNAIKLFLHLQQTIIAALNVTENLDQLSRDRLRGKIESIIANIGYPDFINDQAFLEDYYQGIDFENGTSSIGETLLKIKMERYDRHRLKYGDKYDNNGSNWFLLPFHEFTAGYAPYRNTIGVSQPALDTTIFLDKGLNYIYYGNLGSVLAHEITHSIDTKGQTYNRFGEKENWSTEASRRWFNEKSQCFIDQYNKFYWPPSKNYVNGRSTLNENIADSAVKFAYIAYKSTLNSGKSEDDLITFENFTHSQLFWIANAHFYCGQLITLEMFFQAFNATYPPKRFRVIGMMQNSEDFAKDFNCRVGSYMNPKNKCSMY